MITILTTTPQSNAMNQILKDSIKMLHNSSGRQAIRNVWNTIQRPRVWHLSFENKIMWSISFLHIIDYCKKSPIFSARKYATNSPLPEAIKALQEIYNSDCYRPVPPNSNEAHLIRRYVQMREEDSSTKVLFAAYPENIYGPSCNVSLKKIYLQTTYSDFQKAIKQNNLECIQETMFIINHEYNHIKHKHTWQKKILSHLAFHLLTPLLMPPTIQCIKISLPVVKKALSHWTSNYQTDLAKQSFKGIIKGCCNVTIAELLDLAAARRREMTADQVDNQDDLIIKLALIEAGKNYFTKKLTIPTANFIDLKIDELSKESSVLGACLKIIPRDNKTYRYWSNRISPFLSTHPTSQRRIASLKRQKSETIKMLWQDNSFVEGYMNTVRRAHEENELEPFGDSFKKGISKF